MKVFFYFVAIKFDWKTAVDAKLVVCIVLYLVYKINHAFLLCKKSQLVTAFFLDWVFRMPLQFWVVVPC